MAAKRWPDLGIALLGLWLALSPWLLGFALSSPAAAGAAWMGGGALVVFSGIALCLPDLWEQGLTILWGLCVSVSPWALNFADQAAATANGAAVGILAALLALCDRLRDQPMWKGWHHFRSR